MSGSQLRDVVLDCLGKRVEELIIRPSTAPETLWDKLQPHVEIEDESSENIHRFDRFKIYVMMNHMRTFVDMKTIEFQSNS